MPAHAPRPRHPALQDTTQFPAPYRWGNDARHPCWLPAPVACKPRWHPVAPPVLRLTQNGSFPYHECHARYAGVAAYDRTGSAGPAVQNLSPAILRRCFPSACHSHVARLLQTDGSWHRNGCRNRPRALQNHRAHFDRHPACLPADHGGHGHAHGRRHTPAPADADSREYNPDARCWFSTSHAPVQIMPAVLSWGHGSASRTARSSNRQSAIASEYRGPWCGRANYCAIAQTDPRGTRHRKQDQVKPQSRKKKPGVCPVQEWGKPSDSVEIHPPRFYY